MPSWVSSLWTLQFSLNAVYVHFHRTRITSSVMHTTWHCWLFGTSLWAAFSPPYNRHTLQHPCQTASGHLWIKVFSSPRTNKILNRHYYYFTRSATSLEVCGLLLFFPPLSSVLICIIRDSNKKNAAARGGKKTTLTMEIPRVCQWMFIFSSKRTREKNSWSATS